MLVGFLRADANPGGYLLTVLEAEKVITALWPNTKLEDIMFAIEQVKLHGKKPVGLIMPDPKMVIFGLPVKFGTSQVAQVLFDEPDCENAAKPNVIYLKDKKKRVTDPHDSPL